MWISPQYHLYTSVLRTFNSSLSRIDGWSDEGEGNGNNKNNNNNELAINANLSHTRSFPTAVV